MTRSFMRLLPVVLGGAILLAGCTNPFASLPFSEVPPEGRKFVTLMNEHRVSQGLPKLQWDSSLAGVALSHSAGLSFQSAGENIAMGYSTGQAVFDGWIGSTGHRENIENAGYTHHGLGYVEDGHYWTHVFARNPQSGQ